MSTQHTPGPWEAEAARIVAGSHIVIADCAGRGQKVEANARLIAAAPKLLMALQALVPADFDEHPQDFMPDWHAARAAIAEATGQ